ncbi:MAG: hypothetical protein CVV44_06250 [Spirochaetae bacterium HGW-Spirochaetae-1]|jgi:hypothetical protein|nr:MAG: hypothetical protein CVV44_06250 [Spirochaetae bacterium HGW-Spirochaetae-1]
MKTCNCQDFSPKKKYIKRIYLIILLWIVGRAIQVGAKIDRDIKKEFDELPDDFAFYLGVHPHGPYMVVGKNEKKQVKFMGMNPVGKRIPLKMNFKNIEAAILVLTFQESTTVAFARDRYFVDGNLPQSLAIVRVLNRIETYLLPKVITKLAVKRYPSWSEFSPLRKWVGRILIYARLITG